MYLFKFCSKLWKKLLHVKVMGLFFWCRPNPFINKLCQTRATVDESWNSCCHLASNFLTLSAINSWSLLFKFCSKLWKKLLHVKVMGLYFWCRPNPFLNKLCQTRATVDESWNSCCDLASNILTLSAINSWSLLLSLILFKFFIRVVETFFLVAPRLESCMGVFQSAVTAQQFNHGVQHRLGLADIKS